jgi:hypothetical protein
MYCPIENDESAAALLDYCAGRLSDDQTAILERHLDVCGHCRSVVEGQLAVWTALGQWNDAEISPDFNRRVWAGAAREDRCSPIMRWTRAIAARWDLLQLGARAATGAAARMRRRAG